MKATAKHHSLLYWPQKWIWSVCVETDEWIVRQSSTDSNSWVIWWCQQQQQNFKKILENGVLGSLSFTVDSMWPSQPFLVENHAQSPQGAVVTTWKSVFVSSVEKTSKGKYSNRWSELFSFSWFCPWRAYF